MGDVIKTIRWKWVLLFLAFDLVLVAIFGGWLSQARLDPLLALAPRMVSIALLVWVLRQEVLPSARWLHYGLASTLAFAVQMLVALLLSARFAWGQGFATLLLSLPAFAFLDWLAHWLKGVRFSAILLMVVAIILSLLTALCVRTAYDRAVYPVGDTKRPRLAIMTSLPIVWGEAASGGSKGFAAALEGRAQSAPALVALERRFDVTMLNAADARSLPKPTDRDAILLMAHPAALSPAELVAVDGWVRAGGKALILADALLVWESPFAIGDARNPPVTSLLTPLLDHWGLELALSAHDGAPITQIWDEGEPLLLPAPGYFVERREADGVSCTLTRGGIRADCAVGKGRVTLLSDADMLQDYLWLGQAAIGKERAGAYGPALWRSGNLAWVQNRLLAFSGEKQQSWIKPVWMGERAANRIKP